SVHVRLIWLDEPAFAARFDGAEGTVPPPPPTGDGIAVPLCLSTRRSPPLPSTITSPSETYVYRGRIPSLYALRVGVGGSRTFQYTHQPGAGAVRPSTS